MATNNSKYVGYSPGSEELVEKLIEDHRGWAEAIARSVARSWNLDWELDGLDGGAFEGLVFCARRYDPAMGVPFRAYARRRIHESSTEEARQSKSWKRGVGADTQMEQDAREVSIQLFNVFPELREGLLPVAASDTSTGEETARGSVRQLLASASMLVTFQELERSGAERSMEYKQLVEVMGQFETVHQLILWGIYWEGKSMRSLATEWGIDELNVIREHKKLLDFIMAKLSNKKRAAEKMKIRPGLRASAMNFKKKGIVGPFSRIIDGEDVFNSPIVAFIIAGIISQYGWLLTGIQN